MQIVFFSSNIDTIDEWTKRNNIDLPISCYDIDSLNSLKNLNSCIVVADYDSIASEINSLISSNNLPKRTIVLERAPEIITGKMLISRNIKAYGNSRMLSHHYNQMLDTVKEGNIWTYPALTLKLTNIISISSDAKKLLKNRLSQKEEEVVYLILQGLTNNAIASKLNITTRTVKAHISSIFLKLHINDRVSLILLLK